MDLLTIASLVAALGCGLVAGVFYAFSTFVMRALGRLPPAHGIAAMQAINEAVLTPWFLVVFVGLAPLCVVLGVAAVLSADGVQAALLLAGSGAYLLGTFAETRVVHIPMNDALARVDPGAPDAGPVWQAYRSRWTAWNHLRTLAALLAAAAFSLSIRL